MLASFGLASLLIFYLRVAVGKTSAICLISTRQLSLNYSRGDDPAGSLAIIL